MKYSEYCAICAETDFFCNVPKSQNRKRSEIVDYEVRKKIRSKTKDKRLTVGRYVLIITKENFGTKKWQDWRTVNKVFEITSIKGNVLYDENGTRHYIDVLKNNLIATFTRG